MKKNVWNFKGEIMANMQINKKTKWRKISAAGKVYRTWMVAALDGSFELRNIPKLVYACKG